MLEIAETLAAGHDFLRVDLYDVGGHVYFGELTVYPHSGFDPITPPEWDSVLGSLWRDPSLAHNPHELFQEFYAPSSVALPVAER